MPKGQNPRKAAFAKLSLLDKQLKDAQSVGTVKKLKTLFKAYTSGITSSSRTPAERKKIANLKARIDKRTMSLGKNAISKGDL